MCVCVCVGVGGVGVGVGWGGGGGVGGGAWACVRACAMLRGVRVHVDVCMVCSTCMQASEWHTCVNGST